MPGNLDTSLVDDIVLVDDEDAFETARQLAKQEGIMAGISSGANMWAAQQIAARPEFKGKRIVTIMCRTRCTASTVSGDGRKLPGRWPWAIISGVQPSLVLLIPDMRRAPLLGKELNQLHPAFVRCSMHRRIAQVVDGVDVAIKVQQKLVGFSSHPLRSLPVRRRLPELRLPKLPTRVCNDLHSSAAIGAPVPPAIASAGTSPVSAASNRGVASVRFSFPFPALYFP